MKTKVIALVALMTMTAFAQTRTFVVMDNRDPNTIIIQEFTGGGHTGMATYSLAKDAHKPKPIKKGARFAMVKDLRNKGFTQYFKFGADVKSLGETVTTPSGNVPLLQGMIYYKFTDKR